MKSFISSTPEAARRRLWRSYLVLHGCRSALDRTDHHAFYKITLQERIDENNRQRCYYHCSQLNGLRGYALRHRAALYGHHHLAGAGLGDYPEQEGLNWLQVRVIDINNPGKIVIPLIHTVEQGDRCDNRHGYR